MNLKHLIISAWSALHTNRSRSALTILGIVIGITAIILTVAIGQGAQDLILNEIQGQGSNMVVIRPGRQPKGPSDFGDTLFADSLKLSDIEALKRKSNVPGAADVAPAVIVPGSISYGNETYRPTVFGWSTDFMGEVFNMYPERGVGFNGLDIRQLSSVAVIGPKVAEELFGNEDPLGKNVKIKGRNFRVIGVYPKEGQSAFFNIDDVVIVPYTTAQKYLLGIDYFHEVMVNISDPGLVNRAVVDIEATLREQHGITDPDKDDFFVVTQEGMVEQLQSILNILTLFLASVVAISLVVGGIGIMNIMLVSVTERTKEIGLRKAIGATNSDILSQFLIEAVMLTGLGGIVGVILGVLLSIGATIVLGHFVGLNWAFSFPLAAAILGVVVSSGVGIIFGYYPARQAAKKDPVEALRYE
ncbi:MAG: ABC transporter permease [Patescibacteria group bacterium]|nr:ABC transporter permease [Patescibacteria group bacterium]